MAEKIGKAGVKLSIKAGEGGKTFGSISSKEIAEAAAKQAAKERAAEIKWAEKEMVPPEKKRPGRPRKNPPVELPENILNIQDVGAYAPARAGDALARKLEKAAPLPPSCTLEQFAAWIK